MTAMNIIKKNAHSILQRKGTVTFGNRHIGCKSRSKPCASKGWNAVTKEQSILKCSSAGKSFLRLKPDKCRDLLHHHREGSTRHITWPRKISPLMLHPCGLHEHRPQTAGSNI